MRNMSFSHTTQQIRDGTKTVTRRLGWEFLEPGDQVMACVKCMGLRKGEKVERIRPIEIISTDWEPLNDVNQEEVIREGFPWMGIDEFIDMYCEAFDCSEFAMVNRIEFKYLDEQEKPIQGELPCE